MNGTTGTTLPNHLAWNSLFQQIPKKINQDLQSLAATKDRDDCNERIAQLWDDILDEPFFTSYIPKTAVRLHSVTNNVNSIGETLFEYLWSEKNEELVSFIKEVRLKEIGNHHLRGEKTTPLIAPHLYCVSFFLKNIQLLAENLYKYAQKHLYLKRIFKFVPSIIALRVFIFIHRFNIMGSNFILNSICPLARNFAPSLASCLFDLLSKQSKKLVNRFLSSIPFKIYCIAYNIFEKYGLLLVFLDPNPFYRFTTCSILFSKFTYGVDTMVSLRWMLTYQTTLHALDQIYHRSTSSFASLYTILDSPAKNIAYYEWQEAFKTRFSLYKFEI